MITLAEELARIPLSGRKAEEKPRERRQSLKGLNEKQLRERRKQKAREWRQKNAEYLREYEKRRRLNKPRAYDPIRDLAAKKRWLDKPGVREKVNAKRRGRIKSFAQDRVAIRVLGSE